MSSFAGIDIDVHAVHVVLLDETTDDAAYHRFAIAIGPGGYHEKARRMRETLPARGAWRDMGVTAIAIEEPLSAAFRSAVPLAVVRGAVLSCLPLQQDVPVAMLKPHDWKKWSLGGGFPGNGNAKKDEIAAWTKGRWVGRTTGDQNALDAFAIAWAARAIKRNAGASRTAA